MKIHYKTVILDEENELYSKTIIEIKRKYQIDYCCKVIESAIEENVIRIVGKDFFLGVQDSYESFVTEWYVHSIAYCPFCGEKIEWIEEYVAKQVRHKVHIPKKVIPARMEVRNKEVRVTSPSQLNNVGEDAGEER